MLDKLEKQLETRNGALLAVLVVALVHLLYVPLAPYNKGIISDALSYHSLAMNLSAHREYVDYTGLHQTDFMPAYPITLAIIYALIGVHPGFVFALQAIALGVLPVVHFRTIRKIVSGRAATITFLLMATCPAFFIYETTLNAEIYVLCALTFLMRRSIFLFDTPTKKNAAWFGLSLTLLALAKPEYVTWGLAAFFLAPKETKISGRIVNVAVAGAVGALLFFPWVLRNWLTFHEFIPASTAGGRTFFLAAQDPVITSFPDDYVQRVGNCWGLEHPKWRDNCVYDKALGMVRQHPGVYFRGALMRIVYFFVGSHTEELPVGSFGETIRAHQYGWLFFKIASLAYHSFLSLGGFMSGAFYAWKKPRNRLYTVFFMFVLFKLTVAFFIVAVARYGLQLYPILLMFLGAALANVKFSRRGRAMADSKVESAPSVEPA